MVRILAATAALLVSTPAFAQDFSIARFDVVSIKPDVSSDPRQSLGGTPGRLVGENVPVWWLIRSAFGLQEFQVVGAPEWIFSDRYDIVATMPRDTAPAQVRMMLRAMLADRFGLVTRDDVREMGTYALTADDGSGRRTLERSAVTDCEAVAATAERCGINVNNGTIRGRGIPLSELARLLQQFVGRQVVDRSALEGLFDFELQFAPELDAGGGPANDVSLFTALREQLGLKLQADRGSVSVAVIDRVLRPTAD